MEAEAIPVGLTPQEFSDTQFRLEEIESVLKTRFAADDKFCSQYFEAQVGCCHLVSGTCRKHVPNPPSLPPGFMCAHEYGVRLSHNKTAMDEKKSAKATCKRALDALQTEGTHLLQQGSSQSGDANSQGDLSSTSDPATRGGVSDQSGIKRRRLTLQYRMIHLQSEVLALEGEYYNLCVHQTPVDATHVHAELRKLLRERADLKLLLKIGRPGPPE